MRAVLPLGLCLLLVLADLPAQEPWIPTDHPAQVQREVTGTTRPRRTLVLSAEISGRVKEVRGEVGDLLEAGPAVVLQDVLARHDLSAAQAALTVAETVRRRAQLDDGFRRQELTRIETLAARGRVSAEERDAAAHAAEQAGLALAAAEAEVVRARAGAARSEEQLARHRIDAPEGMTVLRRHVEPGTVVSPGQALLTVGDCRTLTVDLALAADEFAAVRGRDHLEVIVTATGTRTMARVARVAPDLDPTTKRRRVELDLEANQVPEPGGGQEVLLRLRLPDPQGGVLVPLDKVSMGFDRHLVTLADGRVLPITPLRTEDGFLVVPASALPPGAALP